MSEKYSIVLVDDHTIFAQGLKLVIEGFEEYSVIGTAGNSKDALELINQTNPQMAIVDLNLGNEDGLDLITKINREFPECRCLVLSMLEERHYAERALLSGAKGYITKDEVAEVLLEAIRTVRNGEIWLSPQERERHINAFFSGKGKTAHKNKNTLINNLSNRQLRIFSLIGKGLGSKDIADELSISIKTVEAHKYQIKEKLLCATSRELLQTAIEWSNRNISSP